LNQIDDLSLVRDRTGHIGSDGDDEVDEAFEPDPEELTEEEEDEPERLGNNHRSVEEAPKSSRQTKLEDEWGLHRSKASSPSTQSTRRMEEDSGTASDRHNDSDDQVRQSSPVM
jgi:hypothetical protein